MNIAEILEQAEREREIERKVRSFRVEIILQKEGYTVHGFDGGTYTVPED